MSTAEDKHLGVSKYSVDSDRTDKSESSEMSLANWSSSEDNSTIQDKHLGVSKNSTDANGSKNCGRTNNSSTVEDKHLGVSQNSIASNGSSTSSLEEGSNRDVHSTVEDKHLGVSKNSKDSNGSSTSDRTSNSSHLYLSLEEGSNRDVHTPGMQESERYIHHAPAYNNRTFRPQENSYFEPQLDYNSRARDSSQTTPKPTPPTPKDAIHSIPMNGHSDKQTSCSIRKICICAIWIAICVIVSLMVGLLVVIIKQNPNDLKKEMLQGNNNVENLANSLKMVQNSVAHLTDDTQTLRNKTLMLEFREAVIRIIAAYYTNQSCSGKQCSASGTGSGSDSGGQCNNSTAYGCVDRCDSMCDGDYQSCRTCKGFVTCAHGILLARNCSDGHLMWDDTIKRCERVSQTCQ